MPTLKGFLPMGAKSPVLQGGEVQKDLDISSEI